jgi:predicted HTH transcriptional regulator
MVKNNNRSVFPPQEEFERVVKRISKSEKRTNIGLPPNASSEEKAKYKFCKTIACYTLENSISEQELAERLGISHSKVEKVIFCHIDELDLKELVDYVDKLSLPWEIKVNSKYAGEKTASKAH